MYTQNEKRKNPKTKNLIQKGNPKVKRKRKDVYIITYTSNTKKKQKLKHNISYKVYNLLITLVNKIIREAVILYKI